MLIRDMAAKILTDTAVGIAHITVFPGDAGELEHIEFILIHHRDLAAVSTCIGFVPPGQCAEINHMLSSFSIRRYLRRRYHAWSPEISCSVSALLISAFNSLQ